jgi:hypothetical protein
VEIWPKPFVFPKNLKSMTWEQKAALERELLKHNKTSELNDSSDISPSHVFTPEEIEAHKKKKAEKKKVVYEPIVVAEESESLLKSLGIDVDSSPKGKFIDKSVADHIAREFEFNSQPEAVKDAEERFGNIS